VKSAEANYTMQPEVLACSPLYISLSQFSVSGIKKSMMCFMDDRHPSKPGLGVNCMSHSRLPVIASHVDFSNAKHFGVHDTMACPLEGPETPSTHVIEVMEEHAGQVLVLFCPFHTIDDIKINGSYLSLPQAQCEVLMGVLTPEVQDILQNVQDSGNAFLASGRPEDALELNTKAVSFECSKN
jgi:hypothetical protein